jgi:acyl-CoA reductase-like NAD-dependent aldehyde dehydrogenase
VTGYDVDKKYKLLIGGEWVAAADTYDIIDPNTTKLVGRAPEASVAQANDAAAAAKAALRQWKRTPMDERCALVGKIADVYEKRMGALVPLVQAETGSTINVAETMQVPISVERFRFYARPYVVDEPQVPYAMNPTALGPGGLQNAMMFRQPVGVVACITPYNFPLTNVAGKIAPALAMGNTVVIKPAPQDPLGLIELGEILDEVGLPPGVVNIITGKGPEAGSALVDSRDVDMISFTGSSVVGARIFEQGGKTMKRLLMELGGKGALVMTHDCNVQQAVAAIASVWAFHAGQICTAPTRVICHRSIYQQTVDMLAATARSMKVGDAMARDTIVGPLITDIQRGRVDALVKQGVSEGATLVCGGDCPDLVGYFYNPTLLADCTPSNSAVREEFFGPVVVVVPFDDEDEAIDIANDSDYGLFSYVYCGDLARGLSIAKQIESGNVAVNGVQPHMHAPFGGFKMSGIGRDRGVHGLYAYSEIQTVNWPAV